MAFAVETIEHLTRTIDLKLYETSKTKADQIHTSTYDLTIWSTRAEAKANLDDCRRNWESAGYDVNVSSD